MLGDRRKSQRVHAYHPVRLHRPGTPHVIETLSKDLGFGGLRCISPVEFPVSTELDVEVVLATGQAPFSARGRMVWFRTLPESEQFDLGISFTGASPVDNRRLSAYIGRLSPQVVPV